MTTEDRNGGSARSGSESPRRGGRRRRGGNSGEKAKSTPKPEAPSSEAETAPAEGSSEQTDTVQFVTTDQGSRQRRGRRGQRGRRGRGADDVEELGASSGIDVLEDRGNRDRRSWNMEPGLTIRDLLPFLRPPKNILILGASKEAGQGGVAAWLAEAFKGLDRNLMVRNRDLLDVLAEGWEAEFVRSSLAALDHSPALFGSLFETVGAADGDGPCVDVTELQESAFSTAFDELVVDKRPDWLVCTHWLPLGHLKGLKDEEQLSADVLVVMTDPAAHDLWVSDVVTHYLLANDAQRSFLLRHGVDAARMTVTGAPVASAFSQPVDQERVLGELDLKRQPAVILMRPEGIGSCERTVACINHLLEVAPAMSLLVEAGENGDLRQELEALSVPEGSALKVFGPEANMRDLLGVADLLISRAAPDTVSESLAAGVPMILLRPAPGMEERLADRLVRWKVALKSYAEDDLEEILVDLLKMRRHLREMQDEARSHRQPDATLDTVDRVAQIVS